MEEKYDNWSYENLRKHLLNNKVSVSGTKKNLISALLEFESKNPSKRIQKPSYEKWTLTNLKDEVGQRGIVVSSKASKNTFIRLLKESDKQSTVVATSKTKKTEVDEVTIPYEPKEIEQKTLSPSPSKPTPPSPSKTPPKNSKPISTGSWVPKKLDFSDNVSSKGKESTSPTQDSPTNLNRQKRNRTRNNRTSSYSLRNSNDKNKDKSAVTPEPTKVPPLPLESPKTPEKTTIENCNTPRSILKSPYSRRKSNKVNFKEVEVRQYNRCHAGSLGVPTRGGYPLGLDWAYDENSTTRTPVTDYEKFRRRSGDDFNRISETDRRKLLYDEINDETDTSLLQEQLKECNEIKHIRKSRTKIGCMCKGGWEADGTPINCCETNKCICFKNGIQCNEDSCWCVSDTCSNPNSRHSFDEERVHKWRAQRLSELNKPSKASILRRRSLPEPKILF